LFTQVGLVAGVVELLAELRCHREVGDFGGSGIEARSVLNDGHERSLIGRARVATPHRLDVVQTRWTRGEHLREDDEVLRECQCLVRVAADWISSLVEELARTIGERRGVPDGGWLEAREWW